MLNDNIIFLKKNYTKLYEDLENESIYSQQSNITIEDTKNNQKTIKVEDGEKVYYLHSKYDPLREAESIINKFEEKETIDENAHVVFYGVGLGYHIDIFAKRYPNTSFSLYEPSVEVFKYFLNTINLKSMPNNGLENMQCEFNEGYVDTFLDKLLNKINKKIILMSLPIYENVFEEQRNTFLGKFKELVIGTRINLHTNYAFQKRWIINCMKNLKEVLSTPNIVSENVGAFRDKTAILVSAGPSLNEEVENLRYIKDNGLAYIFSVGSAINTLVYNNLYPHAACTIDPGVKNQEVLEIIKKKGITEIPMIFGSSVGYETLENYPGNKYHMITSQDAIASYYLKNDYGKTIDVISDAPTVAAATLQLLYILGFEKIVLVGQNLGYQDKKRYSEGITYSSIELTDEELEKGIWTKDVYGNEILTSNGYNIMRKQIEYYIKLFPNINVVNTTKGGANIEGTEFIELKSIIEDNIKNKVVGENGINGLEKNKTSYDKEYMLSQSKKMEKSYRSALKSNKEYRAILNKIEKSINNKNYSKAKDLYISLDKELKKIENNDFYKIFILPMNRVQYKILADSIEILNAEKSPHVQGERIIKSFKNFIDICMDSIDIIEPIYDEMKTTIMDYTESSSV